ncbi:insulinase family protein [Desulfovibrio sp.]
MTLIHGFRTIGEQDIPEIRTRALVYEHVKTGGRLLSLVNEDENKVFGVSFRTPPRDSTGVAHILEHSVLCGSRKYPVKEPFVELLKGSLQTFLNALTFPDKTCYPVASTNAQDFHNLIDVYLDAVFHPRLTENTLRQEGWHYDPESPEGPLHFKGVVFNEMKGAYSSPDNQLYEYSQHALFPDVTYGLDSGGDPEKIPDLTFDDFMAFHRAHYQPTNAFAFFYGDDDPVERLRILDQAFSEFERGRPGHYIPLQKPFREPARLERPYAAGPGESQKSMFTLNFCLPEAAEPDLNLGMNVLEHILIGLPSSPLRKALMDSGLGEDLAGAGLETDLRQMYFSVGLKGMARGTADRAAELVLATLGRLADEGLDPKDIEAAVNSVEFDLRENNTGSFPRGLSLMFQALASWLHEGDPLALLPFEGPLAALKERLASGEPVFEGLIRRHFLDNPHRALVVLNPDPELAARREAAERKRLDVAAARLKPGEMARLHAQARELEQLQEAPDRPEDLARIPRLQLSDLPRENTLIPAESVALGPSPALFHDLFTNGILYLDLGFDLSAAPDRLLPLVPILGRVLLETGTAKTDFVTLTQRIARKTGGIAPQTFVTPARPGPDAAARLFLRGKCTLAQAPDLCSILAEVLGSADLGNRERVRQIVMETKARREQRLVPAGHSIVATRLKARMGRAHLMDERMHGVTALFSVRELARRVEEDFDSVRADLEELRAILVRRSGLALNVTCDAKGLDAARSAVADLAASLPEAPALAAANREPLSLPGREGLALPAQVNYVGKGLNLFGQGWSFDGSAHVVGKLLRASYLWERVRVQGGAYGAFCSLDRLSGACTFVSYRDPNVDRTLKAFDETAQYLKKLKLDRDELEKAVIGAIGEIDGYMLPDAKGFASLARTLNGEDEGFRQTIREEVLSTDAADFKAFGEALAALADKGEVVVLGEAKALEGSKAGLKIERIL